MPKEAVFTMKLEPQLHTGFMAEAEDDHKKQSVEHRKEIDGLRAIAILSVVFCHAGFSLFGGGFVGVDVFFVISGYLITSIVHRELRDGNFSLRRFYERRARRILPALFLVMLLTLPMAWLWLWPGDFRDFAKSLVYVVLFASNVHFHNEIGYFAPDVDLRPLLHTWSLGVEEQYYILFPLLLMLCWQLRRAWLPWLLLLLALTSLGIAQYRLTSFPEATFYLLPTRAWELLIGAIYAVVSVEHHPLAHISARLRNQLGMLGLALISVPVVLYSPHTPFPGLAALPPTLGTVLVIAMATPDTLVGRWLSTRTILTIGLASYSIYLWHQPIFAFVRYHEEAPALWLMICLTGTTLGIGYLSWRYVEVPFRRPVWQGARLAALVLAGAVFFLAVGLIGKHRGNLLKRFAPGYEIQAGVDRRLQKNYGLDKDCDSATAGRQCQTAEVPEIFLWGDSYAMHLADGIVASHPGVKLIQRTENSCPPLPGVAPVIGGNLRAAESCLHFNRSIMAMLENMPTIRHVVLASPFYQYLNPQNAILTSDGKVVPVNRQRLLAELHDTLSQLRKLGVEPVLVAPPPANGRDLGKCLARSVLLGRGLDHCDFPATEIVPRHAQIYQLLLELAEETRVIWLHRLMCETGICSSHADDVFLFLDSGHLSREGSVHLGKKHDFHRLIVGTNPS